MDLGLAGRIALIAGGNRGVGRAVSLALAREGADVVVLGRDVARTESTRDEVRALGRRSVAACVDVTNRVAMRDVLDATVAELGAPTILVWAVSAVYRHEKLQYLDDADTDALLASDVTGPVDLCRWVLPHMMDARFGRIVGLGSLAARSGVPGASLYAAGKAALEGLTRGIALDYGRRGITANVVAIGLADTERLAFRLGGDEEARERLVRATAIHRIPTPEEIADTVVFLCSPRSLPITGAVVDATAGVHLNNSW